MQIKSIIRLGLLLLLPWQSLFVLAQQETARPVLEKAAQALGGLDKLRTLDNFVMTGFGQRYSTNGNLSPDVNSPPKWLSVTDARRSFDLVGQRALNQERNSFQYPLAASFGHTWTLNDTLQTGSDMLDHPVPAVLAALSPDTRLGPVTAEDGLSVVQFTLREGETVWLGLDAVTSRPYWFRRIIGDHTLGDLTLTTYFTGYVNYGGIEMPLGLMTRSDWRDQVMSMLQVDSYRLNVNDLPRFPESPVREEPEETNLIVNVSRLAEGVWDLRIPDFPGSRGGDGGAVVEFEDHLVMFEPYGSEGATLARLDAADQLVPGKKVTHVITTHHHSDHAGGVRAAVSRGVVIIAERENEALYREWVSRSAVNFPDALAREPKPLKFLPVDDSLILEDSMHRLEIYQVVGHAHMGNAVFAYLPKEQMLMEGDLGDVNWEWHWWAGAMQANINHYGLKPTINIPVHGEILPIEETLAKSQEQAEAAMAFCNRNRVEGIPFFGCPVKYSVNGPVPLP